MSLLKQSQSKNLRSKGFKVKSVLQICLLLAICIWLLHQVKHSYNKKNAYEGTATVSELQSEHESIKLGRKDIHSQTLQTALEVDKQEEEGEFNMEFDEVEENRTEESEEEGRGGGDDEIDGHDQEKLEEEEESEDVEDLIDEADRVEDGGEEQESEGVGTLFEDESLLLNQEQHGDESNSQAKEEHYKGDDAARIREDQAGLKTLLEIQNWSK